MKLLSGLVIFALVSLSVGQTCTGTQTFQNSSDGEHVEVFFNDVSNANLTGQLVPPMIVSPKGVSVKLHFTPTTENSTSGFIATFRIYGCFGFVELSNQTGSITDGSGDNSNYQDLSDCTWLIKGLQGKSIVLTFTSFATENRYDAVTVYDGDSNTTTPIAILSGTSLPAPIIGTQGQDMLVQFASDDSINDAGWTATFELSDNISVPVTTGEISSNETTQEVPSTTGVPLNLPPRSTTCKLYTSRNVPLRVPPGNDTAGTTESTIMVMDSFKVSQVDVVNVNGTHEYMGDLKFYLVAPSGQQTLIADRSCGDSKTFLFSFTDYAESNSWSCPPDGGEWKPDSPLIDLSGISSEGIWKLEVEDVSEQDFGELLGWELRLCGSISEEDNAVSSAQVLSTASALLLGAICLL